ncbi:TlpA family protein disulfide reductase [Candidatus Enterococcus mansonii]|uniref:Thioredoxin domain-containing protein n=1 Tax=Candidatus Enterococcus mansonii TaxID=1834181 RepID=A0A242CIF8_9ENTE|nr:TlpA disulfide reductase family protein [Enterococcus sp. 4G2_DIV0659]OTO10015.1 hypothetical protein A5880_000698 [Enterococcus sp. 4G2_DIV0659]
MKKKPIFLLLSLIVLLSASFFMYTKLKSSEDINISIEPDAKDIPDNKITEDAFNISFQDNEGKERKLSEFKGKPIVLNFWASWCPPCRQEMPMFQKAYELDSDVQYLLINQTDGYRETKQKAQEFMTNEKLTMPLYYDETGDSMIKYGLNALPMTVFIDADGVIKGKSLGALNESSFKTYLDKIN